VPRAKVVDRQTGQNEDNDDDVQHCEDRPCTFPLCKNTSFEQVGKALRIHTLLFVAMPT
jgi:hypothetical protein